uniref:Uncharacterized protein n=1 Tax=Romanomermis culicivorax TaxID=13658 RepID=A0A915JGQ8_ROMCU
MLFTFRAALSSSAKEFPIEMAYHCMQGPKSCEIFFGHSSRRTEIIFKRVIELCWEFSHSSQPPTAYISTQSRPTVTYTVMAGQIEQRYSITRTRCRYAITHRFPMRQSRMTTNTLGIWRFVVDMSVVIVKTVMMPKVTRAGAESLFIQNVTQEMTTIKMDEAIVSGGHVEERFLFVGEKRIRYPNVFHIVYADCYFVYGHIAPGQTRVDPRLAQVFRVAQNGISAPGDHPSYNKHFKKNKL